MKLRNEKTLQFINFSEVRILNKLTAWKRWAAAAVAFAALMGCMPTARAASCTGTATANVMVRQRASTSSTALSTVRKGQTVTVLSVDGDWAKVKDGSRTGYIALRYLDLDGKPSSSSGSSSSSSSTSSSSTLRKGDEGDAVREMQQQLIQLGFLSTEATGYFGSVTRDAVKAFQKSVGISADGVAGRATLSALSDACASTSLSASGSLQKGDEGAEVTALQKMLIQLGYLSTDATGYFGSATRSAVVAFQKAAGLDADGVAGKATLSALQKKTGGSSNASSSNGSLREGDEGEAVKTLQKQLIAAGYLKTDATGFFGSATAAAVRAFQKDHGLDADGIAGAATLTLLNKSSQNTSSSGSSGSSDPAESSGTPVIPQETTPVEDTQVRNGVVLEDWWSGKIDTIIKRGQTFLVTDVLTGKSFTCARYGGENHLDAEPYTAADSAIYFDVFDHNLTWSARAIWLTFDGVTYAAAMNGMPHGGQRITTNNFDGQFCIHFLNSRTHGGDRVNDDMQARIMEAFLAAQ